MKEIHIALTGIVIAFVFAIAVSLVRISTSPHKGGREKVMREGVIGEEVSREEDEETTEVKKAEEDWKLAQEEFKEWCVTNAAVREIRFESDWQISVTLSPDKYTTDENVEAIAQILAGYYKNQSGYPEMVVVTIWSPDYSRYWKGSWD